MQKLSSFGQVKKVRPKKSLRLDMQAPLHLLAIPEMIVNLSVGADEGIRKPSTAQYEVHTKTCVQQ